MLTDKEYKQIKRYFFNLDDPNLLLPENIMHYLKNFSCLEYYYTCFRCFNQITVYIERNNNPLKIICNDCGYDNTPDYLEKEIDEE